jgi:hypothetical protein
LFQQSALRCCGLSGSMNTMIDSWRNVTYKPMLWTDEQINAAAKNTLILKL